MSFKKSITLIFLCLVQNLAFSKKANYFIDGSVWTYSTIESYEPGMCFTESILEKDSIQGDSIINPTSYKKLFVITQQSMQWYYPCKGASIFPSGMTLEFLRYDTLQNKVFMLNDTGKVFSETLLYNFNLIAGDTVPMQSFYPSAGSPNWVIDSVKTISIFGAKTKKYYLQNYYLGNYIIEGVGGSNGLTHFNPGWICVSGGFYFTSLDCFKSGDSIYLAQAGGPCPSFVPMGVSEISPETDQITIFPNPTSLSFMVKTNATKKMLIQILDITGKLLVTENVFGTASIDVSALAEGVYSVSVSSESGIENKKLVIVR